MKAQVLTLLAGLAAGTILVLTGVAMGAAVGTAPNPGLDRPCVPVGGAATEVACLAASSANQELEPGSAWEVSCDSEAWVRTAKGTTTAASGDFKYRAEQTYYFGTGGTEGTNWFACRNVVTNGSCWLRGCR